MKENFTEEALIIAAGAVLASYNKGTNFDRDTVALTFQMILDGLKQGYQNYYG